MEDRPKSNQHLCKHQLPCAIHTLYGFARGAIIGIGIRGVLTLLSMILKGKLFKDPLFILNTFKKSNLKLVAFLSGMIGLYRAVLCFLRSQTKNERISTFVAGFASGLPLLFEDRDTRVLYALYILVRAGDCIVKFLVAKKHVPKIPYIIDVLFGAAITVLHYARVWEPENLNKGYYSMLNRFFVKPNDKILADMTGWEDKMKAIKAKAK